MVGAGEIQPFHWGTSNVNMWACFFLQLLCSLSRNRREMGSMLTGLLFISTFSLIFTFFSCFLTVALSYFRCPRIHWRYAEPKPQHSCLLAHLPGCWGGGGCLKLDRLSVVCLFSVTCIHFQMALKSPLLLSSLLFFFCPRVLTLFKHHFTVI